MSFYQSDANWLSEWRASFDWMEFSRLIDNYSFVSYSEMYFLGSSEKWGGIILDGVLTILGGESNFMNKFEELSGGYFALKDTFEKREVNMVEGCIGFNSG